MSKFEKILDARINQYNSEDLNFKIHSASYYKLNIYLQNILLILLFIYPIGAWLSFWSFSSIAMAVIIVLLFQWLQAKVTSVEFENQRLHLMEAQREAISMKVDTDNQLSELLLVNKELLSKPDKTEEIVDLKEHTEQLKAVISETTEQLQTVITKNAHSYSEELETVSAMKTEAIKSAIASKAKTIETTIYEKFNTDNIEAIASLEGIVERVDELTEHMEYGNLLNEQIRLLMKNNSKLISKNESLTEQVEQLLSYHRNS